MTINAHERAPADGVLDERVSGAILAASQADTLSDSLRVLGDVRQKLADEPESVENHLESAKLDLSAAGLFICNAIETSQSRPGLSNASASVRDARNSSRLARELYLATVKAADFLGGRYIDPKLGEIFSCCGYGWSDDGLIGTVLGVLTSEFAWNSMSPRMIEWHSRYTEYYDHAHELFLLARDNSGMIINSTRALRHTQLSGDKEGALLWRRRGIEAIESLNLRSLEGISADVMPYQEYLMAETSPNQETVMAALRAYP